MTGYEKDVVWVTLKVETVTYVVVSNMVRWLTTVTGYDSVTVMFLVVVYWENVSTFWLNATISGQVFSKIE